MLKGSLDLEDVKIEFSRSTSIAKMVVTVYDHKEGFKETVKIQARSFFEAVLASEGKIDRLKDELASVLAFERQ